MRELTMDEVTLVSGGEVGATGMGDDYSYTGEQSWGDCYLYGVMEQGRSMLDARLMFACLFD